MVRAESASVISCSRAPPTREANGSMPYRSATKMRSICVNSDGGSGQALRGMRGQRVSLRFTTRWAARHERGVYGSASYPQSTASVWIEIRVTPKVAIDQLPSRSASADLRAWGAGTPYQRLWT